MARGERDKADPSLIVETPCIPQPSKRSRGLDYPVTTVNADKSPEKPKAHTGNINRDPLSNKGQSNTGKKPRLTLNTAIKRDKTTPVGEACNPDGTLKDASDMVWVNSPSDLTPPPLSTKRGHDDTDDENLDTAKLMRKQPWRTCTRAGKMTYLDAAWEPKWVEMGMERMRTIFLEYRKIYLTSKGADTPQNKVDKSDGNKLCGLSAADNWMDRVVSKKNKRNTLAAVQAASDNNDPFEELKRFLHDPLVPKKVCPEVIPWWGLQTQEQQYPVIRLMARDYMAIPASSCLAERSFSMSARTDDARRRQMGAEKFRALQRLRAGYRDGQLKAVNEAWMAIDPDFEFDVDTNPDA